MAFGLVLATGKGDAAPPNVPLRHARIVEHTPPRLLEHPDTPTAITHGKVSWAASLTAIEVRNRNTNARAKIRLYDDTGELDRSALRDFMRVAASTVDLPDRPDGDVAEPLDPRLVQLAVRAAYRFGGASIVLVSATRKGSHGKHGTGDALDFQVEGVRAATLAAYARTYPLAGVGIYTHPKTQFIHLDVRDRSYHWIDASPPGVTWREKLLPDRTQQKRDASYVSTMDLPEVAKVPR
jgi:uncharacterized protein YcbK (DUF882 family)